MDDEIVPEHRTQLTVKIKQEHIAKVNIINVAYTT